MYNGPLFIASDHGGFELKEKLITYIEEKLELTIKDLGPHKLVETDDYPDYALPLAEEVVKKRGRGILICRNGIGVCVAANKVKGIRAGIGYNTAAAKSMLADDNTNILCLAANHGSDEFNIAIAEVWLKANFSEDDRHVRRLDKISKYENKD